MTLVAAAESMQSSQTAGTRLCIGLGFVLGLSSLSRSLGGQSPSIPIRIYVFNHLKDGMAFAEGCSSLCLRLTRTMVFGRMTSLILSVFLIGFDYWGR